jgi:hypothetical protein
VLLVVTTRLRANGERTCWGDVWIGNHCTGQNVQKEIVMNENRQLETRKTNDSASLFIDICYIFM